MLKKMYQSYWYIGLILIFLSLITFMFLEMKNNRFELVDYEVYYRAAERIVQGENLYRFDDGFYRYKYSPVAPLIFVPFSLIPLYVSKIVYWIFCSFVITFLHLVCVKLVFPITTENKHSRINNIVLLAGLCLSVHYMLDIHLGQVNFILYLLYGLTALFYAKNINFLWTVTLSISLLIKPFGLIFLPYILIKGKFKQTILIIAYLFILTLIPLIFFDFTTYISQFKFWFNEIIIEMNNKQSLLASENHTIFSVFARYTPLRLIEFTPVISKIYQIILLLIIGLFVSWFILKGRNVKFSEIADFALLTGIIPLLAFTNLNSFGALSLIVYLILVNYKNMNRLERITALIGLILTSGNIYDIWGPKLFGLFKDMSVITLGTLFLIISLTILRKKQMV